MSDAGIEIPYDAPHAVRAVLARLDRTEDVRLSPNNCRLALACFERDSIAIVDIEITIDGDRPRVAVTDIAELSSPCLTSPHGVDFLDDETIIVANRGGNVTVLRLPSDEVALNRSELTPVDPPPGREFELLSTPGSLAIARDPDHGIEVLVCNNSGRTITRHTLQDVPFAVTSNDVLLRRWLDLPDGVAVTADNQWIAISNHESHTVMLYERSASLNESSDPDGILRGASYPHGLTFSADAVHLFVADAGTPYVHVYARDGQTWRGVQHPAASLRVMDDDLFQLGLRSGPEHGGSKGIDIDRSGQVLAVTSLSRPLAFFDAAAIFEPRDDAATMRCG